MQSDVVGNWIVRAERSGENKRQLVLPDGIAGAIFDAGLRACVSERLKTERGLVVVRGLLGVAHPEFHVISSLKRKKIGFGWTSLRSSDGRFHKRERFSDVASR